MKKISLLIVVLFITICASAQDIIYKVDGNEIKAKVIEITTDAIKYKNFEQKENPLLTIPISQVFMVIYEGGEKEVFKSKKQEIPIKTQIPNDVPSSNISKNNISIRIVDNRSNKVVIGKQPSRGAAAVGLIVQPQATVNDTEGKIYSYAEKKLKDVLAKKGFVNNDNSSYKFEIEILELFHEAKAGLYGGGGNVTQNCKTSISVSSENNVIFKKDFNSLYSNKTKRFLSQLELMNNQYSETLDKKAQRKKTKAELKEYSVKGHFINFIVVFDDVVSQLLNDNEFQTLFSN